MVKKQKINQEDYDYNTVLLNTIEKENIINEYFTICPECSSSIEILSFKEENNTNFIEFRCIKKDKKFTMPIEEYLKQVKKKNEKSINDLKDKCQIHLNCNYVGYCEDCKCHLCNECLKTRIHINHKKNNIIEIKPIDKELKIVEKVISDYKVELKKLHEEKKIKERELNEELKLSKIKENNLLKKEIHI